MSTPASVQAPDLPALFQSWRNQVFSELNCHQVGKIVSFDGPTYTASVEIQFKRAVYDQAPTEAVPNPPPRVVDYPILVQVPVVVMTGGTAFLYLPIKAGDLCLVLFNDRDLDAWATAGVSTIPNSSRMHSLSDGIAIVGLYNAAKPPIGSGNDAVLFHASGSVTVTQGGSVSLFSGTGNGMFAQLIDKIRIRNHDQDLKQTMDALCDMLTAWVNTGGSTPNAATVAAIAAVKTRFGQLLE